MDITLKVIDLLKRQFPLEYAELDICCLEQVQEHAFHLYCRDRSLFLKLIPHNDERGKNEICVNRAVLSSADIPAPRLVFILDSGEFSLAAWEWLDGSDLRELHREYLPAAFARLGSFHAAQRHRRPVSSPVTGRAFGSIAEMLHADAVFLCSFYDPSFETRCVRHFSLLEAGYPTFIHGDLHPGHICFTPGGLKFVDWSYAIHSLNLFDLSYVWSVPLDKERTPWWIITPSEAQIVLPAYFIACGMGNCDYRPIHQAVMLWSELWSHYNCMQNHLTEERAACCKNIERLDKSLASISMV